MIAGDGKYRTVVFAKWLVELIVIILRFAEVVDHIAQVKKECRAGHASGLHIERHSVSNAGLICDRGCGHALGRARVAHGMKSNSSGGVDGIENFGGDEILQIEIRRDAGARLGERLHLILVRQVIRRVVILRAGVVDLKRSLVGARRRIGVEPSTGTNQSRSRFG
jgi:hypothetical protein